MLFNSYEFLLIFLPFAVAAVAMVRRLESRAAGLIAIVFVSAAFYGYSSTGHLLLLAGSIAANWWLSGRIARGRGWLAAGIVFNLAVLGLFKYANFILGVARDTGVAAPEVSLALPLAISFYSFQQISFLIDTSRAGGAIRPGFLTYATYVSFFPQLVAGPIVRYREVAHRLARRHPFRLDSGALRLGATLVIIGLGKKVLIADSLAIVADGGFGNVAAMTLLDAWISVIAFGLQIYFDFSGYSDIAIGLARMFGIRLPENFLAPYRARSVAHFWRRWHMTLSRFLRDYLYIPMGGNRRSRPRTMVNLMLVMVLGGLWHGANWTFVIWGAIHGLYLVVHQIWSRFGPFALPRPMAWACTFICVMVAWIPFRANSPVEAVAIARRMVDLDAFVLPLQMKPLMAPGASEWVTFAQMVVLTPYALATVALGLGLVLLAPTTRQLVGATRGRIVYAPVAGALLGLVLIKLLEVPSAFIYFNF